MLEQLKNQLAPPGSRLLTPSLTQPSAEKFRQAKAATARLLANWPESHREGPEYLAALTACLAHLDDQETEALIHPATGLATKLKFLPTPADVHQFLKPMRDRREWLAARQRRDREVEAFMRPDHRPEIPAERRREIVRAALGYDPSRLGAERMERQELPADYRGSEIPDAPPSPYLLDLLEKQGFIFPQKQDRAP